MSFVDPAWRHTSEAWPSNNLSIKYLPPEASRYVEKDNVGPASIGKHGWESRTIQPKPRREVHELPDTEHAVAPPAFGPYEVGQFGPIRKDFIRRPEGNPEKSSTMSRRLEFREDVERRLVLSPTEPPPNVGMQHRGPQKIPSTARHPQVHEGTQRKANLPPLQPRSEHKDLENRLKTARRNGICNSTWERPDEPHSQPTSEVEARHASLHLQDTRSTEDHQGALELESKLLSYRNDHQSATKEMKTARTRYEGQVDMLRSAAPAFRSVYEIEWPVRHEISEAVELVKKVDVLLPPLRAHALKRQVSNLLGVETHNRHPQTYYPTTEREIEQWETELEEDRKGLIDACAGLAYAGLPEVWQGTTLCKPNWTGIFPVSRDDLLKYFAELRANRERFVFPNKRLATPNVVGR